MTATTAVDPAIAAHEARHAAAALLLGLEVEEVRADISSAEKAGHVVLSPRSLVRPRASAIMTLAGRWGDPDWPPEDPSLGGRTGDERLIADDLLALRGGKATYKELVADTARLVARADFASLAATFEALLKAGCVLREKQIRQVHESRGKPQLAHKTLKATARTATDLGKFTAIAAAYTIDRDREFIRRGAFAKSLAAWRARGRPIPLHWAHKGEPQNVIGTVNPATAREVDEGLYVEGRLDLERSEVAREAWRLVKSGTVGLSFGFLGKLGPNRKDGTREIVEIDLYEISLTPAPANPDTRILSFKGAPEAELEPPVLDPAHDRIRVKARDEMTKLLGGSAGPVDPIERERRRQVRELRHQSNRIALAAAMGFPDEKEVA